MKVPVTVLEATLLCGDGVDVIRPMMPPRRAVSIEEFERDIREAVAGVFGVPRAMLRTK